MAMETVSWKVSTVPTTREHDEGATTDDFGHGLDNDEGWEWWRGALIRGRTTDTGLGPKAGLVTTEAAHEAAADVGKLVDASAPMDQ
ncbi:hypothetical protein L1987_64933 [Smallanthus sonchifolius]|uniref:Uncharacterized protein n=1 Tax=Smallanthus sonchifolius TaxID=185202 RepID=A0ACB9BT13_9ASTR|nr:hypothetical protein L1987_64933 [Smallanthus sonchifolius]